MNLRFDFGDKLDIVVFKKSITHSFSDRNNNDIEYLLYIKNFILNLNISCGDGKFKHLSISICEIEKDEFANSIKVISIDPIKDNRFKDIKLIIDLFCFTVPMYGACVAQKQILYDPKYYVADVCDLIKLLFNINNLALFI